MPVIAFVGGYVRGASRTLSLLNTNGAKKYKKSLTWIGME